MPHPASIAETELAAECDVTRTRRGGPGGQHRNRVSTAVVVVHRPTGVSGQASERRSQQANFSVAVRRLRLNLAVAIRLPVDPDRQPVPLWRGRIEGDRIRVSADHPDFPALLAEALDFLAGSAFVVPEAAGRLGVTASQLLRLVRSDTAAWTWLNRNRERQGLGKLS